MNSPINLDTMNERIAIREAMDKGDIDLVHDYCYCSIDSWHSGYHGVLYVH